MNTFGDPQMFFQLLENIQSLTNVHTIFYPEQSPQKLIRYREGKKIFSNTVQLVYQATIAHANE